MKRLLFLLGLCVLQSSRAGSDSLAAGFANPPHESKPLAWWHWVNWNISKEGIKADLEDMKRVGLGGVQIFDVNPQVPPGPVRYGTDEWFSCMNYAIETAAKLGLDVTLQNCPGWATSGGPWVPVEDSMKRLTWSETSVDGGKVVETDLPLPPVEAGFYRDVAVLAVPSDPASEGDAKIEKSEDGFVYTFDFPRDTERRLLSVDFPSVRKGSSVRSAGVIEASADGKNFHTIREFSFFGALARAGAFTIDIPFARTKAKTFRVTFRPDLAPAEISKLDLSNRYRVENSISKAVWGSISYVFPQGNELIKDPDAISLDQVIDVSARVKDGTLKWNAPAGNWTILRIGYTTTATKNHPVQPEAEGYEVDKMDARLVREHFDHSLGRILKEAGSLVGKGKTVTGLLIDSWEAGQQNWTPNYPAEFQKLRGYDMLPFLPVITGRVVGSLADSEGFLQDFSRTIGDLIAENYFGEMRTLAHDRGLLLYGEAYGGKTFDEFQSGRKLDAVMSEFWFERGKIKVGKVKKAASIAHLNGGKLVAAESFSSVSTEGSWIATPYLAKPVGDAAFANGLTVTVLHSYVHQPRTDLKPGFTLGSPGSHFGRLNTWWSQADVWMDYLARSQYLLRQGEFVADVLLFRNAGLGSFIDERYPALPQGLVPQGYDYDQIDPSHFPTTSVENKRIRLPDGASYGVLVLPEPWVASLSTLKHLQTLKEGGVPVIGPPPLAPIGRDDMTTNRAEWEALVTRLFPKQEPISDFAAKLSEWGIAPDCRLTPADGGNVPLYLHRSGPDADIYFIANSSDQPVRFEADFRVGEKAPELWKPVSGDMADIPVFQSENGRTKIQLALDPAGSVFIVFRKPLPTRWATALMTVDQTPVSLGDQLVMVGDQWFAKTKGAWRLKDNSGEVVKVDAGTLSRELPFRNSWQVRFEKPSGGTFDRIFDTLKSWPDSGDDELKWFSGQATYHSKIDVPGEILKENLRVLLDLGEVFEVASVKVNDRFVGTLWKPDFVIDVTRQLKTGENTVEVVVANRWINRIMGDNAMPWDADYVTKMSDGKRSFGNLEKFPEWFNDPAKIKARQRSTFGTYNPAYSDFKGPVPSGLVGPVILGVVERFAPSQTGKP